MGGAAARHGGKGEMEGGSGGSLACGQDHWGIDEENGAQNEEYEDGPGRHSCPSVTAGRSIKGQGCHIDLGAAAR